MKYYTGIHFRSPVASVEYGRGNGIPPVSTLIQDIFSLSMNTKVRRFLGIILAGFAGDRHRQFDLVYLQSFLFRLSTNIRQKSTFKSTGNRHRSVHTSPAVLKQKVTSFILKTLTCTGSRQHTEKICAHRQSRHRMERSRRRCGK